MTTYVQKKTRMFMERPEWLKPERRRSEGRLKTYPSSTDIRNWCDVVEDRRQHILELVARGLDKCVGKLIPIDVIVDMLLAMVNADLNKLKNCMKQLWKFVYGLNLAEDDLNKLNQMVTKMDSICKDLREGDDLKSDECEEKCVARERHSKEKEEIEDLVKGTMDDAPVIQTRMHGPGKMVTRIKGLQPGFEVIDDPSKPTHISIKPAKRATPAKSPSESRAAIPIDSQFGLRSAPLPGSGSGNVVTSDKLAATRMKGLQPGLEAVDDPSKPSHVSINRAKSAPSDNAVTPDKLAATEALCKEQQNKIAELTKERDNLKTKLDACLKELDSFKKLQTVANPSLPVSCQQEIEALEAEINIMRSGNPSPEEEAEIIKKEVEILKRYCSKLEKVENENERLKVELGSRVAIKDSEYQIDAEKFETLKDKLKHLEDLTKERDMLANKVHMLEKQLLQYQDLPENLELLKNRSDMLDSVMQERDNLSQKVKMMKGMEEEIQKFKNKADRVDELERELKNMSKGDRSSGIQLKKTQSIAGNLEIELQNVRSERDAMQKRIDNMKKEMDSQKFKSTEAEMLRLERDRLQIKLNELADIQGEYDEMMNKMKIFDNIKAERDMYKQKYEEVLEIECKCEMLKTQIEEARSVGRERDHLQKQVQDLEACICEQEDEIKSLVLQVDNLSKTRNDVNNRMNTFKEEMTKKDRLLAASQDQLSQSQNLGVRIRELEKLLHNAEHMILQKDCHIKCLENELNCRTDSINASKKLNKKDLDAVELMRRELEAAKAENRRLQEVANKMLSINGDDHVKKMLKQSECAVKRVVHELGKQYQEWDHMKKKNPKGKLGVCKQDCLCSSAGADISSGDDCEKLREELEELQKEKYKLELTVKQLQSQGISPKSSSKCPISCRKADIG